MEILPVLVLLARLVLVAVFAVSGIAKLADRDGSRQAVVDFGVPESLATGVAGVLPFVELAVAVGLLLVTSLLVAAVAGVVLFGVFSGAIMVNLARGRRPDCHCFGQLSTEPIGWTMVARNFVLLLLAAFVTGAAVTSLPQISAVSWVATLSAVEVVGLLVALVALALSGVTVWFLLQLLGQHGRLLIRLEELESRLASIQSGDLAGVPTREAPAAPPTPQVGLAPGTPAPAFELHGLYGERMTLDALRAAGNPVLLLFGDPHCGPCNALLPDVGRWQRELAPTLTVTVISRGEIEENRGKRGENGLTQVLLQQDREVSEAYQAWGTPSALLVRTDGTIGSYVAQGAEAIRALVSRQLAPAAPLLPTIPVIQPNAGLPCPHCGQVHPPAAAAPSMPAGLPVGSPAPAVKLPDLTGNVVDLEEFHGRDTLLVFWNPGCGFCQRLLPDLKAWEQNRPANAPAVVVVSTGTVEANEAHGLMSTIVLDDSFGTGAAFGASGTPSAVLVDATGKIASPVGVGGPAVLALANRGGTPVGG